METPVKAEAMLGEAIKRAESVDAEFLGEMAVRGDFSEVGARRLASALEVMMPHFDLTGEDAKVVGELLSGDMLGEDLTRKLLYSAEAINDAIDDNILSADMECDLDKIKTDQDLTYLAGKIRRAAADKGFRRWLDEEIEDGEMSPEDDMKAKPEAPAPAGEEVDALFMARM